MNDQTNDEPQRTEEHSQVVDVTPPSRALSRERLTAGASVSAIIPRTFEDVQRIANVSVKSGLLSRDLSSLERATVAIMFGAEIGLKPMASLQRIAVINGRPCVWGDAVPAIAFDTGECIQFDESIEGEGDAMTAYCKVGRKFRNGAVIRKVGKFSVAQAKKAKLWDEREIVTRKGRDGGSYQKENDSPWFRFPERMLTMRARVALRDLFADAMCGLYLVEELVDRDSPAEMRDVTPQYDRIANPLGGNGEKPTNITTVTDATPGAQTIVERDPDGNLTMTRLEVAGASDTGPDGNQPQEYKVSQEPPIEAGNGKKRQTRKKEAEVSEPAVSSVWLNPLPTPWNRQSSATYVAYACAWIENAPNKNMAEARWNTERAIRNGLANPLDKEQIAACQDALGRIGS